MVIINGKEISSIIKEKIKSYIDANHINPNLTVIRVGEDEASKIYVSNKKRACEEVGIVFTEIHCDKEITTEKLINCIKKLNTDNTIDGILVQLPLPNHIDTKKVLNTINEYKDVDGLTDINQIKSIDDEEAIIPCTPKGIIRILKYYHIPIEGKHAVIIGRSNLVGKPLANQLLKRNATVTICHSKTKDLTKHTLQADILVSAVGCKNLITENMIKENAVVIDVGISKDNNKIYGDVSENVNTKPSYITKNPGGVGPMTVAMLLENVLECYNKNKKIISK